MNIKNVVDFMGLAGYSGLFFACGSFGIVDGDCNYTCEETENTTIYRYTGEKIALTATFTQMENGVVIRKDTLQNLTNAPLEINNLSSRFCMDGNAYEVYTQYNSWVHESTGAWQKLHTQITAAAQGVRGCDGATPMMALHNLYTGRNTVFHILPNAQWKITARKYPQVDREMVVVEAGFNSDNLRLQVAADETIELPQIIFFNAESKTDLDAYKLHTVYNALYPRRTMPVIYNSWLYCFDKLDIDDLKKQASCAAELGFEAFMIDAGWFGHGENWSREVGDWSENLLSGPKGRLLELSNHVREMGMIFGLWFEPERAGRASNAVKEHPDYYINGTTGWLLDFSNPDAVDYMVDAVASQIEKYQIGWVKLDFNGTALLDPTGNGFYRYMQGQRRFIEALQARFPQVYITNCASGGYRMELSQGTLSDSFWLSDNQGPYEGIRIVKDTLKRMPTGLIERWNVQKYAEGLMDYDKKANAGRMLSCNNATWDFIISVKDDFTKGFLTGGPMGWSCDLEAPDAYKALWKEWIAQHKQNREFYKSAVARILVDTEAITVIEYADTEQNRCLIQVFTKTVYARNLIVYPWVDQDAKYRVGDDVISGKDLAENGILLENFLENDCRTIEIVKE